MENQKRKRESPNAQYAYHKKVVVKDYRLQNIIDGIKRFKSKEKIIKDIRQYVQHYSITKKEQLHTLLLRFLRELKWSFEKIIVSNTINQNIVKNPNVIFINNIRKITQTMQELSIDMTEVIDSSDNIYKILINDEYNNFISKSKTNNGYQIEFSAMIIMTIAEDKLNYIGKQNKINDILDLLESPTRSSPKTASPARSSPKTASPARSSPKTASPTRYSPKTASPARSSPKTASPTRYSPKTASPTRSSPKSASLPRTSPKSTRAQSNTKLSSKPIYKK
jgi:hypothetical protein